MNVTTDLPKKFNLEIKKVVETEEDVQEKSFDSKDSVCVNSDFLDGLHYNEAKAKMISRDRNERNRSWNNKLQTA